MMTGISPRSSLTPTSVFPAQGIFRNFWAEEVSKISLALAFPSISRTKTANYSTDFIWLLWLSTENISRPSLPTEHITTDGLQGLPKKQDSRQSRFPQWQTRTLFNPGASPCPPKYTTGSCISADPLGSRTVTLLKTDIPFLINMQKYATSNSNLKCHPGLVLLGWSSCIQRHLQSRYARNHTLWIVHPL